VNPFKALFFPPLCIICKRRYADHEEIICTRCHHQLPYTDHPSHSHNEFVQHFWGRIPIQHGGSLLTFSKEHGVRDIIHRIKYQDDLALAQQMGAYMAFHFKESLRDVEALIPVPLHKTKQKLRGYNQCDHIAMGILDTTQIPILHDVLERTESTETQTHKSRSDRAASMIRAFTAKNVDSVRQKHIAIIDDMMTTGATLEGCANALLQHVDCTVSMFTLAMGNY